jgi:RNA polymerase sigma-70 factor (ECF subfamily)
LLFTTAQNLALDQLRRKQVIQIEPLTEITHQFVSMEGRSPAEAAAHNQELDILTQAIQSLPTRCRQVLTLRKIYGLPQKEIASSLGIAEHTVEAQVANGMRRVADYLSRLGLP